MEVNPVRSRIASASQTHMLSASQTHLMFNLFKGTSMGFPGIALLHFFSRENLRTVIRRSRKCECFANVLPRFFSGEIYDGLGERSPMASASQTHIASASQIHFRFSEFSFSRERLKVVIRVIALPRFFSREIYEGVKRAIARM